MDTTVNLYRKSKIKTKNYKISFMVSETTSFPCIELSSLLMRYKHTIVRNSTQIINDHIHSQKKIQIFLQFCSFTSDVISKTRDNSAKLSVFSDLASPIYPKNAPTI